MTVAGIIVAPRREAGFGSYNNGAILPAVKVIAGAQIAGGFG